MQGYAACNGKPHSADLKKEQYKYKICLFKVTKISKHLLVNKQVNTSTSFREVTLGFW